jgi:threonine synthase
MEIQEGSKIVCTLTGHGLKDPEALANMREFDVRPVAPNADDVLRAIGF